MLNKTNLLNKLFDEEESNTEKEEANSTAIKNSAEHFLLKFSIISIGWKITIPTSVGQSFLV